MTTPIQITIEVEDLLVRMEMDTGVAVSIILLSVLHTLPKMRRRREFGGVLQDIPGSTTLAEY